LINFDSSFEQVKKLVEDFQSNESKFLSSEYQEAEVRRDFIDKFLFALGWDIYHNEQKNPYEQEVKVEKGVYVGKQQKRADYAFHLAPNFRDVKFYVEAKKPSRNLSNADDYFQSIRYGWNAGTQITFLTDFQEFHILDCRIKPDISSILNYKIKKYHYSDFLNEEKFSEIYWLLSREAVVNNSLEKFAESLPKPKGKAILKGTHRGIYQSIDEAFLEELDEIRDSLAKAFKKANPYLESEPLTEMTQRLIDRLVFIRFLEDKQIEPDHYVSEFANSKSAWKDFRVASRKLDTKYNGVVFKKHTIDSDNFIEPDDETFSSICEELAHVNSPYNFDIIPIHILGSIYERFLGKVVVATDKRVRIEEKPEVRKAGGVYYTPQYIVNYIVDNTVGKLIDGKTPKEISKMRFADISCGSGSFLITVFDRLLEHHRKWYQENAEQAKKDGCYFQDGKWVLSLKQKQKILTNNIYGVDLDHQAVEVTQLSLYLKLLEDETTATTQDTWVMFKEQLLPNLNNNIVCGNSLVGRDIFEGSLFRPEDEMKLKPMNFEDAFPEVMSKGGFDAIVGNPPYGFRQIHENNLKPYFKNHFESSKGSFENYFLFLEKGLTILKKSGKLGFIVPVTWLTIPSAQSLRKFVLNGFAINRICWLPELVFKNAIVNTLVVLIDNLQMDKTEVMIYDQTDINSKPVKSSTIHQIDFIKDDYYINIFTEKNEQLIVKKLLDNRKRLGDIARPCSGYNPYEVGKGKDINGKPHTKETILNKPYHSDQQVDSTWKPEIVGRDLGRYSINNKSKRWIKYGPWLAASRDKSNFYGVRILVQEITGGVDKRIIAAYCDEELYHSRDVIPIKFEDDGKYALYVLVILNSSLISWLHKKINPKSQKDLFPKILISDLTKIPIEINEEYFPKINDLAKQIIESKKQLAKAKTENEKEYLEKKCDSLDRQIDNLVYELYDLTEQEIKIVESN